MSEKLSLCSSPGWVHPGDVMKNQKLKVKRRALQARMSKSLSHQILMPAKNSLMNPTLSLKRKNPFKCSKSKALKFEDQDADSSENSMDGTLFQLLHTKPEKTIKQKPYELSEVLSEDSVAAKALIQTEDAPTKWQQSLPVDWSLKSKIRFFTFKSIPWKHTFKTSEEASGTTGFVRCMKTEPSNINERKLDTTANSQFYECCLIWQHPSLPSVSLFPRDLDKISAHTGIYGDPKIASELHVEWGESLRSLYQLIRVRQCPYFYVCAHNFTCLFRAAGVGGVPHTHALITPTTRGFRDVMKKEGIEFVMPYLNKNQNNSNDDTLNYEAEEHADFEDTDQIEEDLVHEESSSFLLDLGLETSQFPGLNQNRVKKENKKFKSIDGSPQSLVYVEDMELQGLINFLLNCGSCVVSTGLLAGVPPTLFSPVAFQGGTLKSLKISGGQVRNTNGEMQNSIEVRGPILPTTLLHLTSLLSSSIDAYSVSLASIPSTLPFSSFFLTSADSIKKIMPLAFASEGLVDCGLGKEIRSAICSTDQNEGTFKTFKEIVFHKGKYKWTDKS